MVAARLANLKPGGQAGNINALKNEAANLPVCFDDAAGLFEIPPAERRKNTARRWVCSLGYSTSYSASLGMAAAGLRVTRALGALGCEAERGRTSWF